MKNEKFKVQVENGYYQGKVDSFNRFISYYYQANLIYRSRPKNILEVGIGGGFLLNYLKSRGFNITTCDFDKSLNPDFVADIRNLPFEENSFDTVVAFEILEHIPFGDFELALSELGRVSSGSVIISIPYSSLSFHSVFKFPFSRKFFDFGFGRIILRVPQFFKKHQFDGQHYWEMGKKDYSRKKIKKIIEKKFLIVSEETPFLDDYHHFFMLKNK